MTLSYPQSVLVLGLLSAALAGCAAQPLTPEERLQVLRSRIDRIDGEMAALVAERLKTAAEIGAVKKDMGKPVVDPAREAAVVERFVRQAGELGVPPATAEEIIRSLIAAARARQ